ncbi:SEC-C domain-containing protein [Jiangella aurantiaca]|uniref:SEC-C domain-containing protein n=1 Tax=Jiangella aurantiaca TaxID=2530373 RepID=A0A4V2YT41_9ACTN|nr:DUF5926 family protein [Jiangella aurantiaca]TDD72387.1 SEC-C domain-containing protein [Jiangella aurantiaca]
MSSTTEVPVVGPRQPCPCGSGKRYKVCHGKQAREAERQYVVRPFAGLPGECDWVAMREIVSAATAPLRLASGDDRSVVVCTLLPGAFPSLVRESGEILLALQTMTSTGDPAADLGHTLATALEAEPGTTVNPGPRAAGAPRLHDLIDTEAEFRVTVHDGFDYWLDPESDSGSEARAALEEANSAVVPAARLESVEAAYWCSLGDRDQVRWVLPYDEEPLLDGLARLHAAAQDTLGEGTRLLGTFRAAGLLVPVWDLVEGTPADAVEEPAAALGERLAEAVAEKAPLTSQQRRARAGLANRQVTIR